ncbi:MAG: hypothetical protein LUE29_09175 [Lachnospiraceae bacterium]|nr:hypothetical protein [Lachnospiraceae bacterium]
MMLICVGVLCLAGCGADANSDAETTTVDTATAAGDDSASGETTTEGSAAESETTAVIEKATGRTGTAVDLNDTEIAGVNSCGFDREDALQDSYGIYYVYSGGEACMSFHISATALSEGGVGLLMFLNGEPQPYRVEGGDGDGDTSYAYFHIFYPPDDNSQELSVSVCFIPVAGSEGDMLELCTIGMPRPYYFISEVRMIPWLLTHGALEDSVRLSFEADAAEAEEMPETTDRSATVQITYEDITDAELEEYEAQGLDLSYDVAAEFYVNDAYVDAQQGIVYGLSEGDTIRLKYVVLGNSYVEYGLTFFIDHEPVLVDGSAISVELQSGKKTVIEVELSLNDFDGSSIVYGVLAPLNYRTLNGSELVGTGAFISASETVFLSSALDVTELEDE